MKRGTHQDFEQYRNTIFIFIKDTNVLVSVYGLCDLELCGLFPYSQYKFSI